MKKLISKITLVGILAFTLTGCALEKQTESEQVPKEEFMLGNTLDDGRLIRFSFNVPYDNSDLSFALSEGKITINDFLNMLEYVDTLNDGGSKIYKYDESNKTFGDDNFYVIECNSLDDITDIFVAKHKENLKDKCSIKIDDLKGVSMTIKEDTLTNSSATVVITDTSDRENIYGADYKIEIKKDSAWTTLETKNSLDFNDIGYLVNQNNTLELDIDWEYHYGKLKPGEYRILKSTSEAGEGTTHYITVEFIIE